jgi:hypothetical protein
MAVLSFTLTILQSNQQSLQIARRGCKGIAILSSNIQQMHVVIVKGISVIVLSLGFGGLRCTLYIAPLGSCQYYRIQFSIHLLLIRNRNMRS